MPGSMVARCGPTGMPQIPAHARAGGGDATSRAVRLALMAMRDEMGYPSALSAKVWGFYDVLFKGREFAFSRPFGSYVMENILFNSDFRRSLTVTMI